jgi:hypothetical protein
LFKVLEGGYSLSSPLIPAAKPLSARQTVIAQAKAQAHAGWKNEAPMSLRTRPADHRELPVSDALTAAVAKNAKQSRGKSKKQTEISDGCQAGSSSTSGSEAPRSGFDVDKPIAATLNDVGEKVPASVSGPVTVASVSPLPCSSSLSFTTKEPKHQHQLQQHLESARDHDHDLRPDHVASVPSDQPNPLTDTATATVTTATANSIAAAAIVSTSCTGDLPTVHVSNASSGQRVSLSPSYTYSQESRTMFAQENGDGGLVKG